MGAAEQRTFTQEDSLKELAKKAAESDSFFLKVFRRAHMGSLPTIVASFSGAQIAHFTSPELWLPQLAGGGKFLLQGYHESNLNAPVGSFIMFTVDNDEPRDVDINAPKKAGWRGPPTLEFPKEQERRPVVDEMPLYGVRSPSAPGSGDSATRSSPAWPRQAGGGAHRQSYEPGEEAFGPRAYALEAERRKLEADKLEAAREKHRAELEMVKQTHAAEMKALEARIESKLSQKPTEDSGSKMLLEFMKQQAEDRRAAAEAAREERRLERERLDKLELRLAEDRRADRERSDRLFEKLAERKEKDPIELVKQVVELTGKKGNDAEVMMKSVHNMVEMQSSMMGAAMDFVDQASRLQLPGGGDNEPAWVKGVDRLIKGIGKMAMARGPAPVLPPARQVVNQQGQPQPAPGQPQSQPQQPQQVPPMIDQIEGAIRIHHPPDLVAKALVHYYKDPSIQSALAEAGGDFELAFKNRLKNWPDEAPENRAYLTQLVQALEKQLQSAGFYADDPPDEEGDESEGGDDEGDETEDDSPDEGDESPE